MNTYNLIIIDLVAEYIYSLEDVDLAKVRSVLKLFEEYGNLLPSKYLKKLSGTKDLWELRAKNIRIFLGIVGNTGVAVHAIKKKSQKTPHQEIETAKNRLVKFREECL